MEHGPRKSITRRVKLHGKFRASKSHWKGGKDVPWLNVSGIWLEQAGFCIGDHINIKVSSKRLIITRQAKEHSNASISKRKKQTL